MVSAGYRLPCSLGQIVSCTGALFSFGQAAVVLITATVPVPVTITCIAGELATGMFRVLVKVDVAQVHPVAGRSRREHHWIRAHVLIDVPGRLGSESLSGRGLGQKLTLLLNHGIGYGLPVMVRRLRGLEGG